MQASCAFWRAPGYAGPWSLARVSATAADSRDTYARDGYRALVSLLDDVAGPNQCAAAAARLAGTGPRHGVRVHRVRRRRRRQNHAHQRAVGTVFRKERNHRSKAVELWRQGAVNIVINSEAKGFAAEARTEHGPCVCDMGLRVADAGQTVETRAHAGRACLLPACRLG